MVVSVRSPAGVEFANVGVIGEGEIGFTTLATSVPAQFSMAIPANIACRRYTLTADGTTTAGQDASVMISIDVEPPDLPISISAVLPQIVFGAQGEDSAIEILARFSDGRILDVTESSHIIYSSSNTAVATVDTVGSVTAIAPGSTTITATYGPPAQNIRVVIYVLVPAPVFTLVPSSLAFGSHDVGSSSSLPMTLTNSSPAPLGIISVRTGGDFSETDDCVASSPLPVDATCTITVTFRPTQTGLRTGRVDIANSFSSAPVGFWLSGTGQ